MRSSSSSTTSRRSTAWIEALGTLLATGCPAARAPTDPVAVTTLIRALLLRDAGNARLDGLARAGADRRVDDHGRATGCANPAAGRSRWCPPRRMLVAATSPPPTRRWKNCVPARPTGRRTRRLALALADGLHHLIGGDAADALRVARSGLALAGSEGLHAYDGWLRVIAAVASLYGGDRAGARSELQRLEAEGPRLRRGDRACIHYLRGWLAALDGDAVAAHREAKMALAVAVETGIPWFECLARIALADLQAAGGDRRGARGAAARRRGASPSACAAPGSTSTSSCARPAWRAKRGDEHAMLEALRAGFRLGREHGFLQPPHWRPQALRNSVSPRSRRTSSPSSRARWCAPASSRRASRRCASRAGPGRSAS